MQAALVVYIVGLVVLFVFENGADDRTWTRAVYIAGGVEAIAFAAAGYLFGKEVHRQEAQKADEPAAAAETAATNGRALALNIKAKALKPATTYGGLGPVAWRQLDDLGELEVMANQLFP